MNFLTVAPLIGMKATHCKTMLFEYSFLVGHHEAFILHWVAFSPPSSLLPPSIHSTLAILTFWTTARREVCMDKCSAELCVEPDVDMTHNQYQGETLPLLSSPWYERFTWY